MSTTPGSDPDHHAGLTAFADECTAFLEANATRRPSAPDGLVWGEGDDGVDVLRDMHSARVRGELAAAKEWRARLFDAGLGWITGPHGYGGRGLPNAYERVFQSIERGYAVPNQSYFSIGRGMVSSAIEHHAGDEIRQRYLPAIHRGDMVACQLFSEPSAGSDLASLRTRAVPGDGGWVINGQKVWTSLAQYSNLGLIICRTNGRKPKHRGLTAFVVEMSLPGVEVRPLYQMSGAASFNEVFFDDVFVADDHRVGEIDDGWSVVMTTLLNERAGSSNRLATALERAGIDWLAGTLRAYGSIDDAVRRDQMIKVFVRAEVARLTTQRTDERAASGHVPGPEQSINKLATTQILADAAQFAAGVLGPRIAADTGQWGSYSWNQLLLSVPGLRLGAGSDEILRNLLGERVLGLPREPQIDRSVAFDDLDGSGSAVVSRSDIQRGGHS